MDSIEKPAPRGDGLNGEFYSFTAREELRFQQCDDCSTWRHMPRHTCARCHSANWGWQKSSGRGTLYTWNISYRSFHPAFNDSIPYSVCVIDMEEPGIRMLSQLVGIDPADYRLGMLVEVAFLPRGETKLPVFRLRR